MGIIVSKFRKKKTSFELLEKLEEQITAIEDYKLSTEQKHKRIVGSLLVYSVGLYVLFGIFCYFSFPASLKQKILYVLLPMLLFPVFLIALKRIISWYYVKKLNWNQSKLAEMRKEKTRLLEEVMTKETYKVAKDILEKFAPENLHPKKSISSLSLQTMRFDTPELRNRAIAAGNTANTSALRIQAPPRLKAITPSNNIRSGEMTPRSSFTAGPEAPAPSDNTAAVQPVTRWSQPSLAAPILARDRNYLDRVVEYLIGDGPGSRYALICTHCHAHNGMALQEEFNYTAFRCCYCFGYNPARMQRPEAPRLPIKGALFKKDSESDPDSTTISSESSDAENEKPGDLIIGGGNVSEEGRAEAAALVDEIIERVMEKFETDGEKEIGEAENDRKEDSEEGVNDKKEELEEVDREMDLNDTSNRKEEIEEFENESKDELKEVKKETPKSKVERSEFEAKDEVCAENTQVRETEKQ